MVHFLDIPCGWFSSDGKELSIGDLYKFFKRDANFPLLPNMSEQKTIKPMPRLSRPL
jgi:hypothetical protein